MRLFHNIDPHACPRCGHKNFLVKQINSTIYLTDRDGQICDSKDEFCVSVGKCLECGKEFDLYQTFNSFIPLTSIRKHLAEYALGTIESINMDETYIKNPIVKKEIPHASDE